MTIKENKKRIIYFDSLRALAVISIILFHIYCRAGFVVYGDYGAIPSFNWFLTSIIGPCSRYGVDLFLMLSGALSLGRKWDIKSFLSKRIPRIVLPFVFWGFVLVTALIIATIINPDLVGLFNSYKYFLFYTNYDLTNVLEIFRKAFIGESYWFSPYWFFWMILGTYLIMPILNRWLLHSDLKEVEYFLVIWLVTCIFDYTLMQPFPIKIDYFTGPIGVVVLGYYLRHTKRKIFNNIWAGILLTVIAMISIVFISYLKSTGHSIFIFERYSIFVIMEVTGIFIIYKCVDKMNLKIFNGPESLYRKITSTIAKYSYGIYLIHMVILDLLLVALIPYLHYKMLLLALFIATLGISLGILILLNRVPYINRLIGAK